MRLEILLEKILKLQHERSMCEGRGKRSGRESWEKTLYPMEKRETVAKYARPSAPAVL